MPMPLFILVHSDSGQVCIPTDASQCGHGRVMAKTDCPVARSCVATLVLRWGGRKSGGPEGYIHRTFLPASAGRGIAFQEIGGLSGHEPGLISTLRTLIKV